MVARQVSFCAIQTVAAYSLNYNDFLNLLDMLDLADTLYSLVDPYAGL